MTFLSTDMASELLKIIFCIAKKYNQKVAVAIFDQGGNLLVFKRDESVFLGAISAALGKAKAANAFRRTTQTMQNRLEDGKLSYLTLNDAYPLEGGVPIILNDTCIGGIGISGAPSEVDHLIALEAVDKFINELKV